MKKHGVLLDIVNNSITFSPEYCMYFGALLFPILRNLEGTKTMSKAKQEDIIPK